MANNTQMEIVEADFQETSLREAQTAGISSSHPFLFPYSIPEYGSDD